MTEKVITYTLFIIIINYGMPFLIFKKRKNKELILILGGALWFFEANLLLYACANGYDNPALIGTFYFFSLTPAPYLLLLIGVIIFIAKSVKRFKEKKKP